MTDITTLQQTLNKLLIEHKNRQVSEKYTNVIKTQAVQGIQVTQKLLDDYIAKLPQPL